jgi:hypothetical protein
MNNLIRKYSHCLFIAFVIIVYPNWLNAQNNASSISSPIFMISSVGSFANTFNNSPAIQFKSTAACIDVQSGIVIFNGERGSGEFAVDCEVVTKFNSLGTKLYPNPVINTTKIQFKNSPTITEIYKISIWTTEGFLVNTRKATGLILTQGLNINVSELPDGTFILRIESATTLDAIKFIKAQ